MIERIRIILPAFAALGVFIGFEFRVVREFDDIHYGWYCSISINAGQNHGKKPDGLLYSEEFGNIFLSSEEMDEIKNRINYLLESEDEENEQDGGKIYEPDGTPSDSS
ncbi:MAG TPA: hypothetical protein P5044_09720 [bacterium]|nr:hypothetical protein [bacterium]